MTDIQKIALAVAIVVGFVVYINVLCALIAWWSGWRALAARFREQSPIYGRIWRLQSARMRAGAHYNHALNMSADNFGLHLSAIAIVPQHPPLHIPWSEISFEKCSTFLKWSFVTLRLGIEEQIPFTISDHLARLLRGEAPNQWPKPNENPSPERGASNL